MPVARSAFAGRSTGVNRIVTGQLLSGSSALVAGSASGGGGDNPNFRYVRQGATGSGNGLDWTNAFASMPATLTRGLTYYIADGSYGSYTFNDAASAGQLITIKKATVADHGTNTGWDNTYGDGQAAWTGLTFTTADWVFDGQTGGGPGSWKTGFGFRIDQTSGPGIAIPGAAAGVANNYTLRHFEIIGNRTANGSTRGIQTYNGGSGGQVTNMTVSYFYMDQIGNCPFFNNITSDNFIIEYGYVGVYGDPTNAQHSEIASYWGGIGNTTFRYNIFGFCWSTGGLMWDNQEDHNARLNVYGNVFYRDTAGPAWDNSNGCIGGWTGGGASSEDMWNMRIYNNTFVNVNVKVFMDFSTNASNNIANNNLFYNCSGSIAYDNIATHNYNHYIASGGTHSEANGTSAASGDPFVSIASLDFRLTGPTTTGEVLGSPYTTDMLGNTRGSGTNSTWDRGALEYTG